MTKNFSFKTRMIYFGAIAFISLAFFGLQSYQIASVPAGAGAYVLLALWSLMALFGMSGMVFTYLKQKRHA